MMETFPPLQTDNYDESPTSISVDSITVASVDSSSATKSDMTYTHHVQ